MLPGGRGNDLARMLGIPLEPHGGVPGAGNAASCSALDLGEADGRTFIGIASCGFDSEANRIANETRLVRGNLVYAYGALRALAGWKPATFTVELDGGEHRVRHRLQRRRRQRQGIRRRHVPGPRRLARRTACSTW